MVEHLRRVQYPEVHTLSVTPTSTVVAALTRCECVELAKIFEPPFETPITPYLSGMWSCVDAFSTILGQSRCMEKKY